MSNITSIITSLTFISALCAGLPTSSLTERTELMLRNSNTISGVRLHEPSYLSVCYYSDDSCKNDQTCKDNVNYGAWMSFSTQESETNQTISSYKVVGHDLCGAESITGLDEWQNQMFSNIGAQAQDPAVKGVKDEQCYATTLHDEDKMGAAYLALLWNNATTC